MSDGTPARCRAKRPGRRRYEAPTQLPPDVRATRTYLFDGACVTVDFDLDDTASASLLVELDSALSFQPRSELVDLVDRPNRAQSLWARGTTVRG